MNRALAIAFSGLVLSACSLSQGDAHFDAGEPNTLGDGARIRDITNPGATTHLASGATVRITGASTSAVDNYDETKNGKSLGTVYLQDFGSNGPYSAVALFQPTFSPTDLHLTPGDVVDLQGTYQENNSIPVQFPKNEFLIQVSKPQVTFRYEYDPPTPRVIDVKDLATYATGRQWLSMLVTIKDVTFPASASGLSDDGKGRKTAFITSGTSQNSPTVTNELFDLGAWNDQSHVIVPGAHVKSITGIVTYFFAMHIAPRTPADIEP
jgi:hypothetical protein